MQPDDIYLDNSAAAPYPESIVQKYSKLLLENLYGNPHSQSPSSLLSSKEIEDTREQILAFFGTTKQTYSVVFTQGATASLKMVGEYFPWGEGNSLLGYLHESHNSVIGIREYAPNFKSFCMEDLESALLEDSLNNDPHLFVLPAQCNFSGVKYDLTSISRLQQSGWSVLLDAASFVGTSHLNLDAVQPNFVALSFYKMFGFPTGIGALLIRNDSLSMLKKKYFGGGTVKVSISSERFMEFRDKVSERLEDGTVDFLGIISLKLGLSWIDNLGIHNINAHTMALTKYLYDMMKDTKYENGQKCFEFYGNHESANGQGPIICFNMFWSDGTYIGTSDIQQLASLKNIHIRTGCFCNPGACQKYLKLSNQDIKNNFESGHVCWDNKDLINGKPTGAVRISFHYASTKSDANAFYEFLKHYFIDTSSHTSIHNKGLVADLTDIYIYPIKSCFGFKVDQWEISSEGLVYDREWALVTDEGDYVNLKNIPKLAFIKPTINLERNTMLIESGSQVPLTISLDHFPEEKLDIIVCGDECKAAKYDISVSQWFKEATGEDIHLVRKLPTAFRSVKIHASVEASLTDSKIDISGSGVRFANESQFLLINRKSVDELRSRMQTKMNDSLEMNFRPNFIVESESPYEEDEWDMLDIGGQMFKSTGPCNRCRMICIDPNTGIQNPEPLLALSQYRRKKGHVLFGQLYSHVALLSTKPQLIKAYTKVKVLHKYVY